MPRSYYLWPLVFVLAVVAFVPPRGAGAASLEPQYYHRAFSALDAGHADLAYSAVAHAHDAALNKVLRAYYMAAPGNNVGFDEIAAFVRGNPDWPNLRDLRMIAEQKMPAGASPNEVVTWFTAYPPITLVGFYRYVDALNVTGQTDAANDLIHTRWAGGDFRDEELTVFFARFRGNLDKSDHEARLDRLLWNGDVNGARRLYPLVDPGMRAAADARLALAGQKFGAVRLLERVPQEWQSDPGLLYERLRWLRRNNHDDDAIDILQHPPPVLGRPEAWWEERQIMIRRLMDRRDYGLAYRLAANHGQTEGLGLLQAQFLAGWLALRFLNRPDAAQEHFETLYQHATTPPSRARGAYWLGRALEALDEKGDAEQAYETAAALNISYYGQLAMTRLYAQPIITAAPEPAIPSSVRNTFYARDVIRAIEHMHELGENARVHTFFKAVMDTSTERADFVLLSELAYRIGRPDLAIEAAKAANQKNMLVAAGGFPLLDRHVPTPPEPAFTHALIRQESMFYPGAASPAGAHGLMQLMPRTAKSVAKKLGLKYSERRIDDPDTNLRLGTSFVQSQIDAFNGSYILALAGYNAGPGRVRQWMEQIGDPRSPNVDPIDWIELIPVPETRNYVQRILENLQIYRARLNGGSAPLLILRDLKR